MAKTAAAVQFGLTLSPLDGTLQPFTEEALEQIGGGRMQQQGQADGGKGGQRQGGRKKEVDGVNWVRFESAVKMVRQKCFRNTCTKDGGASTKHIMEEEERK